MEVARLSGFSHQTVSRHLQRKGGLRPETVEKIDAAIRELNYRPNLAARSMRSKHSGRVVVVLPVLSVYTPSRALSGAQRVAHAAGYQLEIVSVDGDNESQAERVRELVESGHVEGALLMSALPGFTPDDLSDDDTAAVVMVPEFDQNLRNAGVLADGSMEGEIVEYLASLGHRRFLHLAGLSTYRSARNRRQSYIEAIERLGLESHGVIDADWTAQAGYEAIRDLPEDSGVTAIVSANDGMAAGAIRAAIDRGWKVPDDVSVVGWDDEEIARYLSPSLTTVAVDRERQGAEAMQRLIAKIRDEPTPPLSSEPLNTFIVRESTAPPRAPQRP